MTSQTEPPSRNALSNDNNVGCDTRHTPLVHEGSRPVPQVDGAGDEQPGGTTSGTRANTRAATKAKKEDTSKQPDTATRSGEEEAEGHASVEVEEVEEAVHGGKGEQPKAGTEGERGSKAGREPVGKTCVVKKLSTSERITGITEKTFLG